MRAYERLLKYVKVWTESDENSGTVPSTSRQFELAKILVDELKELGLSDAMADDKCYVYAIVPATNGYENAPKLGLIAHLDTAPDFNGNNVNPRVIENYDGQDVILGDSGRVLSNKDFPYLASLKGKTLIVTDGNSLLGGDDKAGIADIMTLIERINNENIPHGKLSICFTPDEEIGAGADHFDIKKFDADFAYTVDGGEPGEIVYENFNAAGAVFEIRGVNIHPGSAKGKMINAQLVAMEINSLLPGAEIPSMTENYEGFYHLTDMRGDVSFAELKYIIRDHSETIFAARLETLRHIEKAMNEKYGAGTVKLAIREQYRNMIEKIRPCMHLVDNAMAAAREQGIEPVVCPIRGGTDGARLSFMGLPCPNLGTGGSYACHGPYEHAVAEDMDKEVDILIGIVSRYAVFKNV